MHFLSEYENLTQNSKITIRLVEQLLVSYFKFTKKNFT